MNLVVLGMAEGFVLTRGLGDSSTEPAPTPPPEGVEDTILGSEAGGVWASTNPMTGLGVLMDVRYRPNEEGQAGGE